MIIETQPLILLLIAMSLAGGLALFFWPRRGLIAHWQRTRRMSDRIYKEDALKQIHKLEMKGQPTTLQAIAGALQLSLDETAALIGEMQAAGLLVDEGGSHTLHRPDARRHYILFALTGCGNGLPGGKSSVMTKPIGIRWPQQSTD
ncbi:MAG: hypothetical protein R3C44_19655 [Chloroflexota bacterium]